jgi:hypothetical protein
LSSGEAEKYAEVSTSANALFLKALLGDWGIEVKIRSFCDAVAARAISQRLGCGSIKHLEARYMWLQEKTRGREIEIHSVKTTENPADILTKHVSKATLDHLLPYFGMIDNVDDSGNIGSKVVMERTSSACKAALLGKIATTSSWKPQLTIALLRAQRVEAKCNCQDLESEVWDYKFLLSMLIGLLTLLVMVCVATRNESWIFRWDPEDRHVITTVYTDDEHYHEVSQRPQLNRYENWGTFLPRFRCTYCWEPRGIHEERRCRDMMAAEWERQEHEWYEARRRAWENGDYDREAARQRGWVEYDGQPSRVFAPRGEDQNEASSTASDRGEYIPPTRQWAELGA